MTDQEISATENRDSQTHRSQDKGTCHSSKGHTGKHQGPVVGEMEERQNGQLPLLWLLLEGVGNVGQQAQDWLV